MSKNNELLSIIYAKASFFGAENSRSFFKLIDEYESCKRILFTILDFF